MTSISNATSHRRRAFTLVELLAVVGVLIILTALLFPAVASLLRKAELARARNEVDMIANAIRQYMVETDQLPVTYGSVFDCKSVGNWVYRYNDFVDHPDRISTLAADIRARLAEIATRLTSPEANPARRVFLEIPIHESGLLVDPWGNPYCIMLDCFGDSREGNLVVVSSAGPDGVFNTEEMTIKGWFIAPNRFAEDDDIVSRH